MTINELDLAVLQTRLKAAEDVCVLYGWTAVGDDSAHGLATRQLWDQWVSLVGSDFLQTEAHPDLDEATIRVLADRRRRIQRINRRRIKESLSH